MRSSQRTRGVRPVAGPRSDAPVPTPARKLRREDGAAAVEFAIVASLFFMLVFGIIDFGFAFHSWNNAANAAREGARLAAVDPNTTDITNRVLTSATGLDPTKLTVQLQCSHLGSAFGACPAGSSWAAGDLVLVIVNYQYNMITPITSFVPGLGTSLNLHSQSEARFEGQ
ncbi:MAG: TadE/TadG family type IV pilus assembly protein [Actinomycetota bacterium]